MDLERVAVTLRERDAWEATDLGFAMVRRWAGPVFATWIAVVWPLAVLLQLALHELPILALLTMWWLKPLYDRFVLAITSRAVFGETPRPLDVLLHLGPYLGRGLLGALTWRRLSPWRSFVLPVDQLEELTGQQRRHRIEVLARDSAGSALLLTAVGALFELCVTVSLFMLVAIFMEDAGGIGALYEAIYGEEAATWAPFVVAGFYLLAMTLVEPFYVGGGFALYVNRRVHLEAWDIELGFRRMARRIRQAVPTAAMLLGLGMALAVPSQGRAEVGAADPKRTEVRTAIQEVLADPEFRTTRTEGFWKRINEPEPEVEPTSPLDLTWLQRLAQALAAMLKWTALVAAAAAIGWFMLVILRAAGPLRPAVSAAPTRPETLFGLDIRPESLPDDLLAAARAHFHAGDATAALSLLYRGALAFLVDRRRVEIPVSATEGECVVIVGRCSEPQLAGDFGELTRAWQQIAYARRAVSASVFDELCRRWSPHLGSES